MCSEADLPDWNLYGNWNQLLDEYKPDGVDDFRPLRESFGLLSTRKYIYSSCWDDDLFEKMHLFPTHFFYSTLDIIVLIVVFDKLFLCPKSNVYLRENTVIWKSKRRGVAVMSLHQTLK